MFFIWVFRPALVQAALPWKVCNLNARVETVLPCQITAACGLSGPAVIRHWHKRSERACSGWQWLACCLVMARVKMRGGRLASCSVYFALVQAALPWKVCNLNAREDAALPCQVTAACSLSGPAVIRHWHKRSERLAAAGSGWQCVGVGGSGCLVMGLSCQGSRCTTAFWQSVLSNYVFHPALVQAALPWKVCNLNPREDTALSCQITAACSLSGPAVIRHWHKRSERACSGWQWLACFLVMGWSWQGSRRTAAFWQSVLSNYVFHPALVQAALPWKVCNLNAREDTALPCQITAACGLSGPAVIRHWHKRS